MNHFRNILLLAALLTTACTDNKEEEQTPPVDERPQYEISITHSNSSFRIPEFTGDALSGTISWGDRIRENYAAGATHAYTTASGFHTVTITLRGAETMKIGNLKGVGAIDLSGFGPDENE